jgi:hypothetical protein
MPEKWSEFVQAMEDKESWLTATAEKEGDGSCETATLLATAALVRGAVNAAEVPEHAQSQSRAAGLAELERMPGVSPETPPPAASWLGRLGSAIQVAFNLIKRR